MPNFATHCKTGAFAGALVGTLSALHEQKSNDHFDWKRLVHYMAMGALGGLLGSALPDSWNRLFIPTIAALLIVLVLGGGILIKSIENWSPNHKVARSHGHLLCLNCFCMINRLQQTIKLVFSSEMIAL